MRHVGPSYIGIDESDDQVEIINILCRANVEQCQLLHLFGETL